MLKKILLLCICLFMGLSIFMIAQDKATAYAADSVYGDIDGNGSVTVRDALLVLRHAVKQESLSDTQKKYADVNGDGKVDAVDALQIMEYRLCILADFKVNEPDPSGVIWIAGDSIAAPPTILPTQLP